MSKKKLNGRPLLDQEQLKQRIKKRQAQIQKLQSLQYLDRKHHIERFGESPVSRKKITEKETVKTHRVTLVFTDLEFKEMQENKGKSSLNEFLKFIINKNIFKN